MTIGVADTKLTDLVETLPPAAQPSPNPAAIYLSGLAKTGRRAMGSQLRFVAGLLGASNIEAVPWHQIKYEHLVAIRTRSEEMGRSAATINLMLAAIRGVSRASWNMGMMTAEQVAKIQAVKNLRAVIEPKGRRITQGELVAIMAGIKTGTPAGKRDAVIVALAYCGGLRRREIAALGLEDVADAGQAIEIKVRAGKGRKDRVLFLDNGAADALRDYISVRGKSPGQLLLASTKSGRLLDRGVSDQAIYCRIKRCASVAAVKSLSPHDMRRSFVSDLLDAGADISVVAAMAGHANIGTTIRYDRRGDAAKKRAAKNLHLPYIRRL